MEPSGGNTGGFFFWPTKPAKTNDSLTKTELIVHDSVKSLRIGCSNLPEIFRAYFSPSCFAHSMARSIPVALFTVSRYS